MDASLVASPIVTFCAAVYVPAGGVKVGVAAVAGDGVDGAVIVTTAEADLLVFAMDVAVMVAVALPVPVAV
jgi:hypothetical protein